MNFVLNLFYKKYIVTDTHLNTTVIMI